MAMTQEMVKKLGNGHSLYLQGSNHPCMILVLAPLTIHNYLAWSRPIKIALRTKMKSGFINGTCEKPKDD